MQTQVTSQKLQVWEQHCHKLTMDTYQPSLSYGMN